MKPVRTLVLVAAEGGARLLENAGVGRGLNELRALAPGDFEDTEQEFTDTPGRQSAAPGMARHGYEARESVREARRSTFAGHVIEALSAAWAKGGFDRIVIAAPPKLLGELRAGLPGALAQALHADLPKDLLKIADRELPQHFADVAAF